MRAARNAGQLSSAVARISFAFVGHIRRRSTGRDAGVAVRLSDLRAARVALSSCG